MERKLCRLTTRISQGFGDNAIGADFGAGVRGFEWLLPCFVYFFFLTYTHSASVSLAPNKHVKFHNTCAEGLDETPNCQKQILKLNYSVLT
jgi:hypothetical protein